MMRGVFDSPFFDFEGFFFFTSDFEEAFFFDSEGKTVVMGSNFLGTFELAS